jgi:hypothetical protein
VKEGGGAAGELGACGRIGYSLFGERIVTAKTWFLNAEPRGASNYLEEEMNCIAYDMHMASIPADWDNRWTILVTKGVSMVIKRGQAG